MNPTASKDPISLIVEKYRYHPSIVSINTKNSDANLSFSFNAIERNELLNFISELDSSKASQKDDIPTKLIKENAEIFADFYFPP